ncbi:MAG: RnfABCDGE type electron transport complex subunit B [Candidatus Omnitrophota bacterium]
MDNMVLAAVLSMAGLACFFASVLAFADKKLKVHVDPKVDELNHLFPGVNCGACGYFSCYDYAVHIVQEGADPGKCRVIDDEAREKLFAVVGVEGETIYPRFPIVCCAAEWEHKETGAEYKGIQTCRAASLVSAAGMKCEYGCIGLDDCVRVCPFDALHMENGLPRVDIDKCTGCGKCAEACPRNIIEMQDKRFEKIFYVACRSNDAGPRVRQICGVGCIACGICEKLSQGKLFKVKDNLAKADYSKLKDQKGFQGIQPKCPTKVIRDLG